MNNNPWFKLLSHKRFFEEDSKIVKELDTRTEYQKDIDRIVFSTSFRRLQNKTQVFPLPQNDFVHTRLTHSLEVSMVGRALGNLAGQTILEENLELNGEKDEKDAVTYTQEDIADIVVAACLAHDLGNPPFGHSGEKAIAHYFSTQGQQYLTDFTDAQKNDFLNFEGNAAGLRLLTNGDKNKDNGGLRLSYATLGCFLKYPTNSIKKSKGDHHLNELGNLMSNRKSLNKFNYFQSEKESFQKICDECGLLKMSFDDEENGNTYARHPLTFIMEASDTLCYKLIDLEDGHKVGLITTEEVCDILTEIIKNSEKSKSLENIAAIEDCDFKVSSLRATALIVLVNECSKVFKDRYLSIMEGKFDQELTDLIPSAFLLDKIGKLCREKLYNQSKILEVEIAGFEVMGNLLDFFIKAIFDPSTSKSKKSLLLLPNQFSPDEDSSKYDKIMDVVDYVARMTDNYAMSLYKRINGIESPSY